MKNVSVQVLTYGHEKYIERCLKSISDQNFSNFEIVVGVDKSTDRTLKLVREFARNCEIPIKIIEQKFRVGAFNNFIDINNCCEGKYIAICDGDDYWTDNDKLSKQFEFMERQPRLAISFHDSSLVNTSGEILVKLPVVKHKYKDYSHSYLIENESFMPSSSIMFRNIDLKRFNKLYHGLDNIVDLPLMIYLLEFGSIGYLEENMSNYVQASTNSAFTSMNVSFRNIEGITMFKLIDSATQFQHHRVIQKKVSRNLMNIFLFEISRGEITIAKSALNILFSPNTQEITSGIRLYLTILYVSRKFLGIFCSEFVLKIFIRLNKLSYK